MSLISQHALSYTLILYIATEGGNVGTLANGKVLNDIPQAFDFSIVLIGCR